VNRQWNVLAGGTASHTADPVLFIQCEPVHQRRASTCLKASLYGSELFGLRPNRHFVPGGYLKRRYIYDLSADLDVPMPDNLPGRTAAGGEAHPEDHVIQPALKGDKHVLAGDPVPDRSTLEENPELLFVEPVDPLHLLLLPKLHGVIGPLAPTSVRGAVLTGRVSPALDATLLRVTLLPLQEQLLALAPAKPTNRSCVSCHALVRPGASWVGGSHCAEVVLRHGST